MLLSGLFTVYTDSQPSARRGTEEEEGVTEIHFCEFERHEKEKIESLIAVFPMILRHYRGG